MALDAIMPRNVMLTSTGRLVLADPVSFPPDEGLSSQLERRTLNLPYGMVIRVDVDACSARMESSELRRELCDGICDERGQVATDVVESVLLGLAAGGIRLDTEQGHMAIEAAVKAIAQHLQTN